jgi:DNA-binding response OmpR family regulator
VKILLADSHSYMRQGLRNALAHEGYRDVRAVGRLTTLREMIAASPADLLILDVDTPDGDAIDVVIDIRNNRLGRNPFMPIIFVTWDSDPTAINRAAASGVDFILMKPLSPAVLFTRIESLVTQRKPFIAIAGYIGPERREKERWGDTRHFEVPNTLRDKLDGKPVDHAAMSDHIGSLMREMNSTRVQLAARKLAATVEQVCIVYERERALAGTEGALSTIASMAKEIGTLGGGGDLIKLCHSLLKVVGTVRRNLAEVDHKEIELLRPLAQSILLAASPHLDKAEVTEEISRAVERFAPKKRVLVAENAATA